MTDFIFANQFDCISCSDRAVFFCGYEARPKEEKPMCARCAEAWFSLLKARGERRRVYQNTGSRTFAFVGVS